MMMMMMMMMMSAIILYAGPTPSLRHSGKPELVELNLCIIIYACLIVCGENIWSLRIAIVAQ